MDGFSPQPVEPMERLAEAPPGLGLIGLGAFGAFCLPHLAGLFRVHAHDPRRDPAALPAASGVAASDLAGAAAQRTVVLAVPLQALEDVARAIVPHLRPGALVVDVCSVKLAPLAILERVLPPDVDIVGTHPLFGPQSGRDGIAGLRIAVCPARGHRARAVARFLRRRLGLHAMLTTAAAHDRQMAHVQALSHLVARVLLAMDLPPLDLTTRSFEDLMRMVDTVRHDSDALFRTILRDNPFAPEVTERFLGAVQSVRESLAA